MIHYRQKNLNAVVTRGYGRLSYCVQQICLSYLIRDILSTVLNEAAFQNGTQDGKMRLSDQVDRILVDLVRRGNYLRVCLITALINHQIRELGGDVYGR